MSNTLIPGLLQTPGYVRALFREGPLTEEAMENSISTRLGRQSTLSRPSLKNYSALLDELVFARIVGGANVAREQLQHLINLSSNDRVNIQVIPFSAGYHRACDGGFSIFRFEKDEPCVVYLENQITGVFVDEPKSTKPYLDIIDSLEMKLLDQEASLYLLKQYLKGVE